MLNGLPLPLGVITVWNSERSFGLICYCFAFYVPCVRFQLHATGGVGSWLSLTFAMILVCAVLCIVCTSTTILGKRRQAVMSVHERWLGRTEEEKIKKMYIYHALINTLSTHMIHSNLNMTFCTHSKNSPLAHWVQPLANSGALAIAQPSTRPSNH